MNVGELFITLGLKGGDKTSKELKGVGKTLGDVSTNALAVKAAIVGVIYGLERIMSSSMQTGAGLQQFSALTGLSTKQLQQWQYAARQVGVGADEVTSNFKSVQSVMAKAVLGEGKPKGMSQLEQMTGFDIKKSNDTFYVMGKLQEMVLKMRKQGVGAGIIEDITKSFGVSEGMIAAFARGAFNKKTLGAAPTYTNDEIKKLSEVSVAWNNIAEKFKMAMGKLTAKEGMPIMGQIDKASMSLVDLIANMAKLADQLQIFIAIGKVFEGWSYIFKEISDSVKSVTDFSKTMINGKPEEKKAALSGAWDWMKEQKAGLDEMVASTLEAAGMSEKWTRVETKFPAPKVNLNKMMDVTAPPITAPLRSANNQNILVNQNLNFNHDGTDPRKVMDSHNKAAKETFRQFPQGRAN